MHIAKLSNDTEDEKEQKKLKELYKYFKENRDGLIPYRERVLDIPEPPLGLEYRNLGTMKYLIILLPMGEKLYEACLI